MSDTPETDNLFGANSPSSFACLCRDLETQRDEARAEVERLRKALQALFDSYKQLADCGDAGNWSLEDLPEGKRAMEALGIIETGNLVSPTVATNDTSPEIFEAHGREWYRHTPGDKMPCDHRKYVQILHRRELAGYPFNPSKMPAQALQWSAAYDPAIDIIGWRPADAPAKLERK